jgi:uncharacterized delta-60 repeat protein
VRYNADGSLDTGFGGGDGIVTTSISAGDDKAHGLALQADGKIIVVGETSGNGKDFAVLRYNADGSLDTSFGGGDGIVTTDFAGGSFDVAYRVVVQADGRIVVGGASGSGTTDFAVARYLADGSLDTSFSGDGKQTVDLAGSVDEGFGLALDAPAASSRSARPRWQPTGFRRRPLQQPTAASTPASAATASSPPRSAPSGTSPKMWPCRRAAGSSWAATVASPTTTCPSSVSTMTAHWTAASAPQAWSPPTSAVTNRSGTSPFSPTVGSSSSVAAAVTTCWSPAIWPTAARTPASAATATWCSAVRPSRSCTPSTSPPTAASWPPAMAPTPPKTLPCCASVPTARRTPAWPPAAAAWAAR